MYLYMLVKFLGLYTGTLFLLVSYNQFLKCVPSTRPLLLLMDGHSIYTLFTRCIIKVAAEEISYLIPPNTMHLLQLLDKGCLGPLKSTCYDFIEKNPGRVVTRYNFSPAFAKTWKMAMTQKTIFKWM